MFSSKSHGMVRKLKKNFEKIFSSKSHEMTRKLKKKWKGGAKKIFEKKNLFEIPWNGEKFENKLGTTPSNFFTPAPPSPIFFPSPPQKNTIPLKNVIGFCTTYRVLHIPALRNFLVMLCYLSPIFGRALYETFTVDLLITGWRMWPGGKCTSISFRNSLATFVATIILYHIYCQAQFQLAVKCQLNWD